MKNLKRFYIPAAAVLIIFLLLLIRLITLFASKPVIAFYGIDSSTQNAIESCIKEYAEKNPLIYKFETYDSAKTLKSQLGLISKPALVFTTSGAPVTVAAEKASKKANLNQELLAAMTVSMRESAVTKDGQLKALPVLHCNMEIDIHKGAFYESGIKAINTWQDIINFSKKQKVRTEHPVIFAGKDPDFLLDLLGALTEAFDGAEQYGKAAAIIKSSEKKFDAAAVADQLSDSFNSPLYSAVDQLRKLKNSGLLNSSSFSLTAKDLNAFLKSNLAEVAFMNLTTHRNLEAKAIAGFSSIYIPSEYQPNDRRFTAKIIYAVPVKKNQSFSKLAAHFAETSTQEQLSRQTGLSPVLASCRTPDQQSSDARFWIAATGTPLPGLSREADLTAKQKQALAAELISKIRN